MFLIDKYTAALAITLVVFCSAVEPVLAAEDGPLQRAAQTPAERFRFAEGLLQRKFFDMAETEFRFFLDQNPDHELAPNAMFRLIECLRARNQVAETMSAINQFQTRWPSHEFADKLFLWKGELLLQEAKYPQAEVAFKRLILSQDALVREAALYFLGQCYARGGDAAMAVSTYKKLSDKEFDGKHLYRPYALFSVASAAQHAGEFETALAAFARLAEAENVPAALRQEALYRRAEALFAREQYKQAIISYELLLVDYPDGFFSRETRKRRAWAYFLLADYAKAAELTRDWKERYPQVFDYEVVYVQAASLASSGFVNDGLPLFRELAASADVPEEYRSLARYQEVYSLLSLEKYDDAARRATEFLDDFPNTPKTSDIRYFAGEAYAKSGHFDKAAAILGPALEQALPTWSFYVDASLRLADVYEHRGDFKKSAAIYRDLAKQPAVKNQAAMLLYAGEFERRSGDGGQAMADFESLLAQWSDMDAESRAASLHLAELYAEKDDYARAEVLVQKLLEGTREEGKGRLFFFLGSLYYQQEKYEDAEKMLRLALAAKDSVAVLQDTKFYLVGCLLELAREDEALALFADILKLPEDQRPTFSAPLLFRLESLYYARGNHDVSEVICRWLIQRQDADVDVGYRASLRLAKLLISAQRLKEAEGLLLGLVTQYEKVEEKIKDKEQRLRLSEINALLGEIFLLSNDKDRAVSAFENTLNQTEVGMEFAVRARWGLAEILYSEGRLKQSLHYAVNAFVLGDDPVYTPRSMLIAIKILVETDSSEKAETTWKELQKRFPSFAMQKRDEPAIKKLSVRNGEGSGG